MKFTNKTLTMAACVLLGATPCLAREKPSTGTQNEDRVKLCKSYAKLAREGLPSQVADKKFIEELRNTSVSSTVFSQLEEEKVLSTLGETEAEVETTSCSKGEEDGPKNFCDTTSVRRLKFSRFKGKLRYLNPTRGFQASTAESIKLTQEEALNASLGILTALGVPESELREKPFVRALAIAGNDPSGKEPTRPILAEQHVRFGRTLNNLPVFDSEAKFAINGLGEVARLHLNWPDVTLSSALRDSSARTKNAIIANIVSELSAADSSCRGYKAIRSFIAYGPVKGDTNFSTNSDDDGNSTQASFVPMLIAYAVPKDPTKEDNAQVIPPGIQMEIPIFARKGSTQQEG